VLLLIPEEGTAIEAWRAYGGDDAMRLDFMYENTHELVRILDYAHKQNRCRERVAQNRRLYKETLS
jgi:hypothetical protein